MTIYASPCTDILNTTTLAKAATTHSHDSSVEAEVIFTPQVANILTTSDGTLGALFIDLLGNERALPLWLKTYARIRFPLQKPRSILWEKLNYKTQSKILFYINSKRKFTFGIDWSQFGSDNPINLKKFNNLKIKESTLVNVTKPTTLFGKTLQPGLQQIPLDMFSPYVELESIDGDINHHKLLLELHIRTSQSAPTNSNDAWTLMELLGIHLDYQHIHVVGPKPKLTDDNIYSLAYFISSVNIMVELVNIYFNYGKTTNYRNISAFSPTKLAAFIYNGLKLKVIIRSKGGYFGQAGESFYDEENVWGLEHRLLNRWDAREINNAILGITQTAITTQSYLSENYLGQSYINELIIPIAHSIVDKEENIDSKISRILSNRLTYNASEQRTHIEKNVQLNKLLNTNYKGNIHLNHRELKMLFFNWSEHPLFYGSKIKHDIMKAAQLKAIDAIIKHFENNNYDEDSVDQRLFINNTMREFIKTSNLFEILLRSLGSSLESLESELSK